MSARHALLAALREKPGSPTKLRKRVRSSLGPAWALNSGQVSQDIGKLERDKQVERIFISAGDADEQYILRLTPAGLQECERWSDEPTSMRGTRRLRRPLLLKLLTGGPERLALTLQELEAYQDECAAEIKKLSRECDAIPLGGRRVQAEHELLRMALGSEILDMDGELKWAQYMHEWISLLKSRNAIWSFPHRCAPDDEERARQTARDGLFDRIAERRSLDENRETPLPGDG